jgi:multiple sugar transport system ATP-binding protein
VTSVPFLALEKLEKTFPDGTRAVKGIDLSVERGEFVVLLGPSGCGKTTTLRMIAGLEIPSGGRIVLDGEEVTRFEPARRDVGFVFQFYALYPHLTVEQNLAFPLECGRSQKHDARRTVAAVAERLGLTHLLPRRPRELSGGDQQRVALGRAMVRRPRIWLMDEPLGTLDADRRLAMCEFLREQQLEAGITTIYVTHDQEEAMRLADRVVVMSDGRIEQAGPPIAVYDDPASLFVARFVGSPGMNFLQGRLVGGANDGAGGDAKDRAAPVGFRPDGAEVAIPLPPRPPARPLPRERVTLGVRPEFVKLSDRAPLRGEVLLDEYLGASRCLHVKTPCGTLVARTPEQRVCAAGSQVGLELDPRHVRLFDPDSGARLL